MKEAIFKVGQKVRQINFRNVEFRIKSVIFDQNTKSWVYSDLTLADSSFTERVFLESALELIPVFFIGDEVVISPNSENIGDQEFPNVVFKISGIITSGGVTKYDIYAIIDGTATERRVCEGDIKKYPKLTLYRYTYRDQKGVISQSNWSTKTVWKSGELLNVETKIIDLEN